MKSIAPYVVSLAFLAIGLMFIRFPRVIRKYDTGMTRVIKDERQYILVCRLFGIVFLQAAVLAPIISIYPQD